LLTVVAGEAYTRSRIKASTRGRRRCAENVLRFHENIPAKRHEKIHGSPIVSTRRRSVASARLCSHCAPPGASLVYAPFPPSHVDPDGIRYRISRAFANDPALAHRRRRSDLHHGGGRRRDAGHRIRPVDRGMAAGDRRAAAAVRNGLAARGRNIPKEPLITATET